MEQPFADLASAVPSTAGYFFDDDGALVIQLVNPGDQERAIEATIRTGGTTLGDQMRRTVRVRAAQFTFAQLAEWRDLVFENLLTRGSGVRTLDLDEARNRVTVGVVPGRRLEVVEAPSPSWAFQPGPSTFTKREQ